MFDFYYCILEGFIVLVEKDWFLFGYMFQLWFGYMSYESWFIVDSDVFVGFVVCLGENDGCGDVVENVMVSVKRFWFKNVINDKEVGLDQEEGVVVDEVK